MARIPEVIRRGTVSQVAARPASSGQGWSALAELAKIGEGFVRPKALEQAAEKGLNSVYRDMDGKLKIDAKNVLGGELADAHNAAAYAKYLSQRNIDISENLTELARSYEFDPAGFKQAADGYLNILREDEDVPKLLKEELIQNAQNEISRRFGGLSNAQTERTYREADRNTKTQRDMLADDYVNLYMAGDEEAAAEKLAEIEALSQYRANADYISETPAEREAYLRGIKGAAQAARLTRRLEDLSGATEISDEERAEIQSILDDPNIDPSARSKLYAATQGRLKGIDANAFVDRLTSSDYESKVFGAESGFDDNAKNPNSTALGPHQFLKGTWSALVKKYKPAWANGLTESEIQTLRTDRAKSSEMFQHFRRENQEALRSAGLPVNDATEYMAHFFGSGGAISVLSADPDAMLSDVVPASTITANPFLKNMTVRDARNWAARKMTVKASDIANMRVYTDQIEDQEVRAMAQSGLMDQYNILNRQEQANALEYEERLKAGDDTLTEQEVYEDHSISDAAQDAIVSELRKLRKDQIEVQDTVFKLNDPGTSWDAYDNAQRKSVDKAYTSMLDGASPLSAEGQTAAGEIAMRTGFVPQTMFGALRSAVNGGDPEAFASAMEFTNQVLARQPGALNPYGGSNEVQKALDDYAFFSGFMGATDAAARVIENNSPEMKNKRRNLSDAAKAATKNLKPADVSNFMTERYGSISLGTDVQQASLMSEYTRLFEGAFIETGDEGLAKNRALSELSRVYGPNEVTGDSRIMRYPPQNFYPSSAAQPDWMARQIEDEVSAYEFGDDARQRPGTLLGRVVDSVTAGMAMDSDVLRRIPSDRIFLNSDERTRADVSARKAPSYTVMYRKADGELQQIPGRFSFDPSSAQAADVEYSQDRKIAFDEARQAAVEEQDEGMQIENLQRWENYMRGQGMSVTAIKRELDDNGDMYRLAPPPME